MKETVEGKKQRRKESRTRMGRRRNSWERKNKTKVQGRFEKKQWEKEEEKSSRGIRMMMKSKGASGGRGGEQKE